MSSYSSDTRLSRQRQVTTLSVYNETVEEVVENAEYWVKFSINSAPITLEVKLPPEFPECPPVIVCSPPLLHPWITKGGRVTGIKLCGCKCIIQIHKLFIRSSWSNQFQDPFGSWNGCCRCEKRAREVTSFNQS